MAKPSTLAFANFKIYVGNSGSPETFAAPCGFTQKALQLSAATTDTLIPDCDDPTAATWTEKGITSLSATVTGQGVMAEESLPTWREWWESAAEKNIRVAFEDTLANNGGYYEGSALCTALGFSVALNAEGNKVQIQVTVENASAWTWVDALA